MALLSKLPNLQRACQFTRALLSMTPSAFVSTCHQTYYREASTAAMVPTDTGLIAVSNFFNFHLSFPANHLSFLDWNAPDDLFSFTRGRFVLDEADQIASRHIRFNMNELARIAAESVGAKVCVAVEKCPDGMYNKSFVLAMDNGQEVIAKVPNPNAGISHLTTASEVATMDFVSI